MEGKCTLRRGEEPVAVAVGVEVGVGVSVSILKLLLLLLFLDPVSALIYLLPAACCFDQEWEEAEVVLEGETDQ